MSAEHHERAARRIAEELFNQGDLSVADELIAPNAVDHNEPPGTDCREHFKRVATLLRSAFPDLHMHIEDVIADEEKIALRITMTGTHSGPGAFAGLPPSDKRFQVQQMRFARFVGGQMTESWAVIDMFAWGCSNLVLFLLAGVAKRSCEGNDLFPPGRISGNAQRERA